MALDIMKEQSTAKKIIIYIDNQVVIKTLANPQSKLAQYMYIVQHIAEQYNRLACSVKIHWIPVHTEVSDNEIVNWLVKQTAN